MKINGYEVEDAELSLFISEAKTLTVDRYVSQLNYPYDNMFWSQSDGETTAEEYFGKQLKRLSAENKTILILSSQSGLIDSPDYLTFLKMMREENRIRKEKKAAGEVIYGVLEFTEETYHSYLMTELREELKKRMADKELAITEDDIKQYYNKNLTRYMQANQDKYIIISAKGVSEEKMRDKLKTLEGFRGKADEFRKLCQNIRKENPEFFLVSESTLPGDSQSQDSRTGTRLYENTTQTEEGTSGNIWEDASGAHVVYCVEKVPGQAIPMTEVKQHIKEILSEERLNELISLKGNEAVIETDSNWLEQVPYR